MICRVKPPSSGNTAQYYSFDEADIDQDLGYPYTSYIFLYMLLLLHLIINYLTLVLSNFKNPNYFFQCNVFIGKTVFAKSDNNLNMQVNELMQHFK